MPLQLNTPETERSKCLVWNPESPEEKKEAKEELDKYIGLGFWIERDKPGEVILAPPPVAEGSIVFRVLSKNGDDRLLWNSRVADEVREAKKKFKDYLDKGYKAYTCRRDGKKGAQLDSFDALLEEAIMVKEAILVPSTMPG